MVFSMMLNRVMSKINFARRVFSHRASAARGGVVLIGLALTLALLTLPITAEARERATRSPLNIIPKTKVTLSINRDRDNQEKREQVTLPQLKPGGVKLSRPVRSVSALPGGRGVVQIGVLGNLEDADIGLQEGLGPDLWQASRLSTVARLFKRVPESFELPAAGDIAYQLMTTIALPPPGLSDKETFFAQRLAYLMKLGKVDGVRTLLNMTGAEQRNSQVTQIAAEVALVSNDIPAACNLLGQFPRLKSSPATLEFAIKLRAFCQLEAGDLAAAMLLLDLARENGMKDTLFLDAMFSLTAGVPYQRLKPVRTNKLSIIQAMILLKTKAPLFTEEVAYLNPTLINHFVESQNQPQNIQLLLAQRGVSLKLVPLSYLYALMDMVSLSIPAPIISAGARGGASAADDIIVRARQMRIVNASVSLEGKILALQDLLLSALTIGDWSLIVKLVEPNLQTLQPTPQYADFALYAVPAFIHLGDLPRAVSWYEVLLERQKGLPSAKSRNLNGLIRLMDNVDEQDSDKATQQILASLEGALSADDGLAVLGVAPTEAVLMNAILKTGSLQEITYVKSEINLLPFFGYRVPDYLQKNAVSPLNDKVLSRSLKDMEKSVAAGQRGTALMHALIAIGRQEQQKKYNMSAMRRVLRTLQSLKLTDEARNMARHILIQQAAYLAMGA